MEAKDIGSDKKVSPKKNVIRDNAGYPGWVDQFRGPGKEVRRIGGRYYLYGFVPVYDSQRKRTLKKDRQLLGRLTEKDGLIPKGSSHRAERKPRARKGRHVRYTDDREYGISYWMETAIRPLYYGGLAEAFGPNWKTLVCFSLFRLAFRCPICDFGGHYSHSYISEMLPGVPVSPEKVSGVLAEVGSRRHLIVGYLRSFAAEHDNIIFDGTDFECNSALMAHPMLTKLKTGGFGNGVGLMCGFSVANALPIYYRIADGDVQDVTVVRDSYKELALDDLSLIADKGHCSAANIEEFNKAGVKFVMPLKRSVSLDYDAIGNADQADLLKSMFGHMGRHVFHVTLREKYHGATVHLFLDECLRQDESHDALDRLEKAMEARRASEEEADAANAVRKAKLDEAVERELKRGRKHYTDKPLQEDTDRASEAMRRLTEGTDEYDAVTPKGKTVDELVADYQAKAKKFGTIALAVNNGDEAKKAYMKYKTRDSVEKMIDVLKNVTEADRMYMQNPDVAEGWMFCNILALHFYYRLYVKLKENKLLNHHSPQDVLLEMSRVRAAMIDDKWHVIESTNVRHDFLEKAGILIPYGKQL